MWSVNTSRTVLSTKSPAPLGEETWTGYEHVIEQFERVWREGGAPAIDEFWPAAGERRLDLLRELVQVDLEFRLQLGESVRLEPYLERYPELAGDSQAVLELIAAEYELRRRREVDLGLEEYARRFPGFRDQFADRLRLLARLAELGPGTVPKVPGYEILAELGRGGMGVVYQARETKLGRLVALKFLPRELASEPLLLERFIREAQTASALNHPHICTVHALGEHEGRPFIVLEFIEGQTLKALATRGISVADSTRLVRQAAAALEVAHAAGVVHRDIKPENLMVRPDGYTKVLDFGLARRVPTLQPAVAARSQDTWPGAVLGTVNYMSPEQARGEPLDGASDIFSLGIVMYLLVTGRHPFERGAPVETMHAIASEQPAPPRHINGEIPAALANLIEAMLHKDSRLRPTAGEVAAALASAGRGERGGPEPAPRLVVRREPELAALRQAIAHAAAGRGSVVCIAGEPGIGKTTLVEDFLQELASGANLVARGRCTERQAAASAYLPVIDALADLMRGPAGGSAARLMSVVAPSWAAQLAPAAGPDAAPASRALSQPAMLREFAALLTEIARLGTVVLFLDDVHWADLSTVDLLDYISRNCRSLAVLVIVTYRPTELLLGPHPFHRVKLEIQGQRVGTELALPLLGPGEIDRYLAMEFPGHAFPANFAELIYSRTEGNPLFMADLLRYLREREIIAQAEGRWALSRELPTLWQELPESVRSMIECKLQRLDEPDRKLLAACAVQGQQFDSAVAANVAGREAAEVEESLQRLDRVHGLVRLLREDEFPDRTLTLRYRFVHVLYQQALLTGLPPTRRAAISKAVASAWRGHLTDQAGSCAAELAYLFEAGRDFGQSAAHFLLAARNAAQVFAHRDAVALARHGLHLLRSDRQSHQSSDAHQRNELELRLQTVLGLQMQVTDGYASPTAETAYERARELSEASPELRFPVLWGLWLVWKVRSHLPRAQELAAELLAHAGRLQDPDLALQAHQALGLTALCRGSPAASVGHVEQVVTLYHPERHRAHAFLFGQDPAVICKAYGGVALWLLGFPEAAQRQCEEAIAMSRGLSPNSQAVAWFFAGMVYQLAGDPQQALRCAEATAAVSAEHGYRFWLAGGTILGGWALAADGDVNTGVSRLRQGLRDWRAIGSVTYVTYFLGLLAEALLRQGELEQSLEVVEEALALVLQTDERMVEAEMLRLRGELRLAASDAPDHALAEADFRRALEIAARQQARALELRAAMSLTRLQQRQGHAGDGLALLAAAYDSFREGLPTPDLADARTLLGR
jgi:predicted ATPase